MKKPVVLHVRVAAICAAIFGIITSINGQTFWSSASGTDTNWSTGNNWSPAISPGSSDAVRFNNTAVVLSPATVDNVVDADFTIKSLQFSNFVTSGSANYHVTQIADGRTLTILGSETNGLSVGMTNANTALVNAVITGSSGTLTVNGGTVAVSEGAPGDGLHLATLDASGLGTFNATVSKFYIGAYGTPLGAGGLPFGGGSGNGGTRAAGLMYLAQTNFISISGSGRTNGLLINWNANSGGATMLPSSLYLGRTNVFHADSITVGSVKSSGSAGTTGGALLAFNPTFTANTPVAYFRGTNGDASRISYWDTGNMSPQSSNQNAAGTNDLTGGVVDALINNMTIGVSSAGNVGTGVGVFSFNTGTVDANNVTNGWSVGSGADTASGAINIGGGIFKVNNTLALAIRTTAGVGVPVGTLNINGGTLQASNMIVGAGTSAIRLANAVLILTNGVDSGTVGTFAISNSILTLPAVGVSGATIPAGAVAIGGSTNIVNITSIPILANYPAILPIISYTTFSGVTNIGLGSLPVALPAFQGYITNDGSSGSINLVLTTGPALARSLFWNGQINSTWDADGTSNWHTNGGAATTYHDLDFVTFDDTAVNHTVSLAQTLTPSDVIVSNNTTYTFNGGGSIAGSTALTKYGTGSLILDNTGANTFGGGITFSNCTVQVGNNDSGGSLGTGPVQNDGLLVFSRANSSLNVSNIINGSGPLTKNGSGTVTLSGVNTFDGSVTVNAGVLAANNNSALGDTNGTTTVISGASLDVSGRNLGQEQVYVGGSGADAGAANGAIFNSGATASPALARLTLTANTVVGGAGRWDLRGASVNDANGASLTGAYNLTKVGANMMAFAGVTVDPGLGDISIQSGNFSVESATTGLGDPAKTLTLATDATLSLFNATNQFNKNIVLNGNGISSGLGSLNNSSGTNTVVGAMTLNGSVEVTFKTSASVQTGGSLILSNSITGDGSLVKENTNTLVLAGPVKNYGGGTVINDGTLLLNSINNNSGNVLTENVSSSGGKTILGGSGTNAGPVDIEDTLWPGAGGKPATFSLGSGPGNDYPDTDSTLALGAQGVGTPSVVFSLGSDATVVGGGVNDLVAINGDFDGNFARVKINPLGTLDTSTPYTLITYTGSKSLNFASVGLLSGVSRYNFTLNYPSHVVTLSVSGGPALLKWNNNANNGQWDTQSSQNWFNTGTSASDVFYDQDTVLLDDSITSAVNPLTTITIPDGLTVTPNIVTNNSSVNYTIAGAGKITGNARIVKTGSSTLTILNTNDFAGPVTILQGSIAVSTAFAIGSSAATIYVTNGGTLDLSPDLVNNGINFGAKSFVVSGSGVGGLGAIINNGTNQQNAFQNITLTGNTTFGGSARFDIRGGTPVLSTGGQPWSLTKKGIGQFTMVGVSVDTNLANIDVQGGSFGIQDSTTLGNPTNTLTVENGALLHFNAPTAVPNKVFVLQDGATVDCTGGSTNNVIGGPVILQGSNSFALNNALYFTNSFSGTGSLYKSGGSTLWLEVSNSYTGNTVINGGTIALTNDASIGHSANLVLASGTLNVSGRSNGALTLNAGQTLAGSGTLNGSLTNNGNVSPGTGAATGILTVTANAVLNSTTTMKLDKANSTNDVLAVNGGVTYGGTLTLTTLSGTLANGDQFKLFKAGTYTGNFTGIIPAHPNNDTSLNWDATTLNVNGILKVISSGPPPPPHITSFVVLPPGINGPNGWLTILATNGTPNGQLILLSSTNIALPLAQWTPVLTNNFDSNGNLNLSTNVINSNNGQQFYILSQ